MMIKTHVWQQDNGWQALAICPICGAMVYIGTTPHKDEACDKLPAEELVALCKKRAFRTRAESVAHTKFEWAWEHADVSLEDYIR